MYPQITLGGFRVGTYLVMYALALVVLGVVVWRRDHRACRLAGEPAGSVHRTIDALFYVLLGTILGGWVAGVLPPLAGWALGTPLSPAWWAVPLYWPGQLGGGSLAGVLYCRRRAIPAGRAFDIAAPAVPLAQAIGRVGCLMAGCCYGKVTEGPLALFLPDIHGVWAMRYPTRIADILANLTIVGIVLAAEAYGARRHGRPIGWPFPGFLFLLYVALYCLQRFVVEFGRADMPSLVGPLTWIHLYCAAGFALATWLVVRNLRPA